MSVCNRHKGAAIRMAILSLAIVGASAMFAQCAERRNPSPKDVEFFEKKIRPLFVKRCLSCHSTAKGKTGGGLALDTRGGWLKGGDSGSPITRGKPAKSLLIEAVRYNDIGLQMPPEEKGGKLPPAEIALLVEWIKRGAPDTRIATARIGGMSKEEASRWWSLQPVRTVEPPIVQPTAWPKNDVDRFVLAELREQELQPAQDADALTLLRRLSFVLTGLPPSPKIAQAFPARFAENADAALLAVVEKLQESPHYGERIARHWMDVVRYTDTYGYEWDNPAKGSWEYRDYLIRAFNRDIGFDQLIREQIAGDLLQPPRIDSESGFNESLIGPMFYHMGEHRHGDNVIINGVREEMIDNKIDAFSKSFLAMTVACARCHDHKLDPVLQRDYYALAGVFMTPRWTARSIEAPQKNAATITKLQRLRDEIQSRLTEVWTVTDGPLASAETVRAWAEANHTKLMDAKLNDIGWPIRQLLEATETKATWMQLVNQWRVTHESRTKRNAENFTPLHDFAKPNLPPGWIADGDGMRTGYVTGGKLLISLEGDSAVTQLLPQGYHTHALSPKLPGALRLPSQQDLPGKFVSVALAGGEWSGYLRVADNGFQTEDVKFLDRKSPAWQPLADIAPTNGIQRIAYEIATSDLNPNFPPRTGVAKAGGKVLPPQDEGFDKRSWFSITGIVSHNAGGQPADELGQFAKLYAGKPPTHAVDAWSKLQNWLRAAVIDWKQGRADNDDVALINWMLKQRLLANTLSGDAKLAELVKRYRKVESSLPYPRTANSMDERKVTPINYAMNVRGDIDVRGEAVPRDFLQIFSSKQNVGESSGSGRLQLAKFLADPQQGLTARVYVNRVWQWVFGAGLVRTPNDFGKLGDRPSHPELLDYLAKQFMEDGWSTKRLIRQMVLSRTFRQAGAVSPDASRIDPNNRWLHHHPTRRLEAEAIRDTLLSISGRLNSTLYGRPINPRRHAEDPAKRLFSGPLDGDGRRSIYLEVSIMDRSKFLQSFNAPDPKLPTGRRDVTSVPAQALVMLNDPFVLVMADHWAETLLRDNSKSVETRLNSMFLRALGRPLRIDESARWTSLIKSLATGNVDIINDHSAWTNTAHTLFNTQEFIHYK